LAARPWTWRPLLTTQTAAAVEHVPMLQHVRPTTVIDVGANKGQFTLAALHAGAKRVIAFEPLRSEAAIFRKNVAGDPRVELHEVALAETEGEAIFHVADRADSSSLLRVGKGQTAAFGVAESHEITVPVRRLDAVLAAGDLVGTVMLKIDVQGAERQVIDGASGILEGMDYVYTEASFVELYDGQPLAGDIVAAMSALGFAWRGVYNTTYSSVFGPTQGDLLFESEEHV